MRPGGSLSRAALSRSFAFTPFSFFASTSSPAAADPALPTPLGRALSASALCWCQGEALRRRRGTRGPRTRTPVWPACRSRRLWLEWTRPAPPPRPRKAPHANPRRWLGVGAARERGSMRRIGGPRRKNARLARVGSARARNWGAARAPRRPQPPPQRRRQHDEGCGGGRSARRPRLWCGEHERRAKAATPVARALLRPPRVEWGGMGGPRARRWFDRFHRFLTPSTSHRRVLPPCRPVTPVVRPPPQSPSFKNQTCRSPPSARRTARTSCCCAPPFRSPSSCRWRCPRTRRTRRSSTFTTRPKSACSAARRSTRSPRARCRTRRHTRWSTPR